MPSWKKTPAMARREASAPAMRQRAKQFQEAKHGGVKSWKENNVFDLVGLRKTHTRSYIPGRW
eukprot:8186999-Prorocentrum_lima.AAC.1